MTNDEYLAVLQGLRLFHEDGHSPFTPCVCGQASEVIYEAMIQNLVMGAFYAHRNTNDSGPTGPRSPEGPNTGGGA